MMQVLFLIWVVNFPAALIFFGGAWQYAERNKSIFWLLISCPVALSWLYLWLYGTGL